MDEWKDGGIEKEDLKLGEPADLRLERSQRSDYCHANNGICSGVTHMRMTSVTIRKKLNLKHRGSPRYTVYFKSLFYLISTGYNTSQSAFNM